MANVICISHSQDVDGLVCATLLKMAKNANYVLADYSELLSQTRRITGDVDELYLCDLGLQDSIAEDLVRISKFARITYIDHHPLSDEVLQTLKELGVKIVHSVETCAGALVYQLFRRELPEEASLLAAYAVLSDYPSADRDLPFSVKLEPQMVLLESALLSYAVARACDDSEFKKHVVESLSQLEYPHNIENMVPLATQQLQYIMDLIKNTDKNVSYSNNVAYVQVLGSTGIVANALVHSLEKPLVVCYREFENGAFYYLSVRTKDPRYDLGSLAARIAKRLKGSGGGHPMAAAAQLPKESFSKFIELIDESIEDSNEQHNAADQV